MPRRQLKRRRDEINKRNEIPAFDENNTSHVENMMQYNRMHNEDWHCRFRYLVQVIKDNHPELYTGLRIQERWLALSKDVGHQYIINRTLTQFCEAHWPQVFADEFSKIPLEDTRSEGPAQGGAGGSARAGVPPPADRSPSPRIGEPFDGLARGGPEQSGSGRGVHDLSTAQDILSRALSEHRELFLQLLHESMEHGLNEISDFEHFLDGLRRLVNGFFIQHKIARFLRALDAGSRADIFCQNIMDLASNRRNPDLAGSQAQGGSARARTPSPAPSPSPSPDHDPLTAQVGSGADQGGSGADQGGADQGGSGADQGNQRDLCELCYAKESSIVLVHGKEGHGPVCEECSIKSQLQPGEPCPWCRKPITSHLKLYKS